MIPKVTVRCFSPASTDEVRAIATYLGCVPQEHRFRVVVEAGGEIPRIIQVLRAAKNLGYKRIRVEWTGRNPVTTRELFLFLRFGTNEFAFGESTPPDLIRSVKTYLAHTTLILSQAAEEIHNAWGANEIEFRVDRFELAKDPLRLTEQVARLVSRASAFDYVAVRGIPLCQLPTLDPKSVISNSVEVIAPLGVLKIKSWDLRNVFFAPCRDCSLFLACDGFTLGHFCNHKQEIVVCAFGTGKKEKIPANFEALLKRAQPPTFLSGRVHLWAVADRVRPAGRCAVKKSMAEAQLALIKETGLCAEIVEEVPEDFDRAEKDAVHIFFATDPDTLRRVADIQRRFVRSQFGEASISPATFAWQLGLALGYPECCIKAFVETGPKATTTQHLRRASAGSAEFLWPLNCLDPLSPLTLIPHLPCRFDCQASLRMAEKVLLSMDSRFPGLFGAARELLRRPALLFPEGQVVKFCGSANNPGEVIYDAVDVPCQGLAQDLLINLLAGKRIQLYGDNLEVETSDGCIKRFNIPGGVLLFPFK